MDDMQAVEQRLARELLRQAGPSEPVDDAAIFDAITTTRSPKWRFPSMFSATKFVIAGAVVALFGGFLLAGVLPSEPTQQQPPAAATESVAPASPVSEPATEFSGRVNYRQTTPGGRHIYRVWEMSDPRLEGEWVQATTDTLIPYESGPAGRVWHGSFRIENDEGAWEEVPNLGLAYPDETATTRTSVLIGDGAYAGLNAIVEFTRPDITSGAPYYLVRGVITSVDLPPPPSHEDSDP